MIRLENVTKLYDGGVVALKDVSIDASKGEFVFLVGPSGSGKSTLIRLMMREEQPTNGDIWIAGKHASKMPSWKVPHLRRSIGTVFQDFKLLPNKTVYENVSYALEVTGRPRHLIRNQVPQVLKLVGLSAKSDRYPRQLSGGEQQRVSVARAFVNRPLILLADEPTGNLDPATSVGIMRILDRINRTGTTVVMATHDHAIVDAMRRRVVQLERGRVVRDQSRGAYEQRVTAEPVAPAEIVTTEPEQSRAELELAAAEAELAELPIDEGYPNGADNLTDLAGAEGAFEDPADSPQEAEGIAKGADSPEDVSATASDGAEADSVEPGAEGS